MKKLVLLFSFFSILLSSCHKDDDTSVTINPPPPPPVIDTVKTTITGYNMRWRDTPDFETSNVLLMMDSLNPKMFRYPGGTLSHKWNWETGLPRDPNSDDIAHAISDVKKLAEATTSTPIFVLDIVNSSLENQLAMLHAVDMPIRYIELGNELYADDYEAIFPDGKSYADTINRWTPSLQNAFPDAKIGAVMIGRTAGNDRKNNWNTHVHENIGVDVDAYIYHIYVNETESVEDRIARFELAFLPNTGKELWVTEYGAKSQNLEQSIAISDYIDSIAVISLNHCLVARSGDFSKLTLDGNEFTEEGLAYLAKYN